jgi:hypothetical protein
LLEGIENSHWVIRLSRSAQILKDVAQTVFKELLGSFLIAPKAVGGSDEFRPLWYKEGSKQIWINLTE